MKITLKISLLFFITATVFTIIAASVFYAIAKHNLVHAILDHLATASSSRADHIETYLAIEENVVVRISQRKSFQDFLLSKKQNPASGKVPADISTMVKGIEMSSKDINEAFLIDVNGRVAVSSDKIRIGQDKSSDAYFTDAKEKPHIKGPYFSESTKKNTIAFSAPVTDPKTKEFLGVIVIKMSTNVLDKIATSRIGLGKTGEIYLINKDHYMITPSRFTKDTFFKVKVDTEGTRVCLHPREGQKGAQRESEHVPFMHKDYRGVEVLGVSHYIPEAGWILMTEIDAKEVFQPLLMMKLVFVILVCFIASIVWVTGLLVAKFIVSPIQRLEKGAEIIGEGNLNYKVATDVQDEVGDLSRAFDKMVLNLKETAASRDRLDTEVKARLKAEKDLEKKIAELEKFNKFAVGRELKMRELKEKISELEENLKKLG